MKKADVEIGGRYIAKVSGSETVVRITNKSIYKGWDAVNVKTGRPVRIKTAARLRRPAGDYSVRSTRTNAVLGTTNDRSAAEAYCDRISIPAMVEYQGEVIHSNEKAA